MNNNLKYQGNDFEEWYKTHYNKNFDPNNPSFSKTEGMTDTDMQIGNSLYQAYLNNQTLQNQYNTALQGLEANKKASQQNADITMQKLQKYLPEYVRSQGLGGLGISALAGTQAYNNYLTSMSDIASNYGSARSELEQNYLSSKNENLQNSSSNIQNILSNYATKQEQEMADNYNNITNIIANKVATYTENGNMSNAQKEELKKYVEDNRASLGDHYADMILKEIEAYETISPKEEEAANVLKQANRSEVKFKNKYWLTDIVSSGDNFEVTDADGNSYKIQFKKQENDPKLLEIAKYMPADEVFEYNGQLYMILSVTSGGGEYTGTVWSLEGRPNSHKNDYNALTGKFGG